jgi:hypothetical protein
MKKVSVIVPNGSSANFTVEQAILLSKEDEFKDIVIIGWDKDDVFTMITSKMTRAEVNYLIDVAKKYTLNADSGQS